MKTEFELPNGTEAKITTLAGGESFKVDFHGSGGILVVSVYLGGVWRKTVENLGLQNDDKGDQLLACAMHKLKILVD